MQDRTLYAKLVYYCSDVHVVSVAGVHLQCAQYVVVAYPGLALYGDTPYQCCTVSPGKPFAAPSPINNCTHAIVHCYPCCKCHVDLVYLNSVINQSTQMPYIDLVFQSYYKSRAHMFGRSIIQ